VVNCSSMTQPIEKKNGPHCLKYWSLISGPYGRVSVKTLRDSIVKGRVSLSARSGPLKTFSRNTRFALLQRQLSLVQYGRNAAPWHGLWPPLALLHALGTQAPRWPACTHAAGSPIISPDSCTELCPGQQGLAAHAG
jgi:hypothetical protein